MNCTKRFARSINSSRSSTVLGAVKIYSGCNEQPVTIKDRGISLSRVPHASSLTSEIASRSELNYANYGSSEVVVRVYGF